MGVTDLLNSTLTKDRQRRVSVSNQTIYWYNNTFYTKNKVVERGDEGVGIIFKKMGRKEKRGERKQKRRGVYQYVSQHYVT